MMHHPNLLNPRQSAMIIIDIQDRLLRVMKTGKLVTDNVTKLIKGCNILHVPVHYTEQYPKGLGRTDPNLQQLLEPSKPVEKIRFSACGEPQLIQSLSDKGIKQIFLVGMETHVCILQTALDFLQNNFQVYVVTDAVCSRNDMDKEIAIERMQANGITITTTESVLFELTETAGTGEFKQISQLLK